jgi:hypothetical protein
MVRRSDGATALAAWVAALAFSSMTWGKPPGGGPPSASASNASAAAQPASSAAPASGASASSTTSSASFESQMLAFHAIDSIATKIASDACAKIAVDSKGAKNHIVIYDQTTFANVLAYSAFIQNAKLIESAYSTLTLPAKIRVGTAADAVTGQTSGTGPTQSTTSSKSLSFSFSPLSDITGLLSAVAVSANTETYGSVIIPDSVMALAVTKAINNLTSNKNGCDGAYIVYPPLFGQGAASDQDAIDIQGETLIVQNARKAAHESVYAQIAAKTSTSYPALSIATALTDIDGLYDNFMNALLQPSATTGVLGSAAIVQGHQLADLLNGAPAMAAQPKQPAVPATPEVKDKQGRVIQEASPGIPEIPEVPGKPAQPAAYVLLATVITAGGTVHDHKTFWTNLGHGDQFTYSGGAIVAVALWQGSIGPGYSDILRIRLPLMDATHVDKSGNASP